MGRNIRSQEVGKGVPFVLVPKASPLGLLLSAPVSQKSAFRNLYFLRHFQVVGLTGHPWETYFSMLLLSLKNIFAKGGGASECDLLNYSILHAFHLFAISKCFQVINSWSHKGKELSQLWWAGVLGRCVPQTVWCGLRRDKREWANSLLCT